MSSVYGNQRRFLRAMWVRNTIQVVEDNEQIEALIEAVNDSKLTDLYLHVAPRWYGTKSALISSFNSKLSAAGIRIWALDGRPEHIKNLKANEPLMDGLRSLIRFNENAPPCARFHGFHVDIQPHQTPAGIGGFHVGIPESRLTALQKTERDLRMHIWLNCLTQVSNFIHSYDMPVGAIMPFWLHSYEGEPITGTWVAGSRATGDPHRTCMMDMIMPMFDQYIVQCSGIEPAETVTQMMFQVRYACDMMREGHDMPIVLGSVETATAPKPSTSQAAISGPQSRAVILADLDRVESVMAKYPAFGGMMIHDWSGWDRLPPRDLSVHSAGTGREVESSKTTSKTNKATLSVRMDSVLQELERLKSSE